MFLSCIGRECAQSWQEWKHTLLNPGSNGGNQHQCFSMLEMNASSPRQQRKSHLYIHLQGLPVIFQLGRFDDDLEFSPLGKSLLKERVNCFPASPSSRRRHDVIGGWIKRFKHKLGQRRRGDGRKCFKERDLFGEPIDHYVESQPTKRIESCQSETPQAIAVYGRKSQPIIVDEKNKSQCRPRVTSTTVRASSVCEHWFSRCWARSPKNPLNSTDRKFILLGSPWTGVIGHWFTA